MELYIIRHGQSYNNALKDSTQRVCDPPLTETGKKQADRVAEYLKTAGASEAEVSDAGAAQNCAGYEISRIYCSAMLRTLQTTAPIGKALGMDPEIWIDVHEEGGIWLDKGDGRGEVGYPGMTRSEIGEQFPGFVVPEEITDEGWWNRPAETEAEWRARAGRVAAELHNRFAETDERIAMVCHGGFANDLLHALLKGMPDEVYFSQQNTAISRLDFDGEGRVRVRYVNRVEHLPPEWVT